jgi:large subunit ribosomal protein L25
MAKSFELNAEARANVGKGASRRLRRAASIPAIVYGAGKPPQSITLNHEQVRLAAAHEAFFSHILTLKKGDGDEQVVLRDMQRHPARPIIMHMDFQRVSATEKLHMRVPLHFLNEATAPGIKTGGGVLSHHLIEVEVACLPKDLPEFIAVDLGKMELGDVLHLSDVAAPSGVDFLELAHGSNPAVVSIHHARVEEEAPAAEAAAAAPAAAPAAKGGAPAKGAAPAAPAADKKPAAKK